MINKKAVERKSKDWTGNKAANYATLGASNHSDQERVENDFYATPPSAVEDLLKVESFSSNIWECACGMGHIADVLKVHGYTLKCSDIVDRGYEGTELIDFLDTDFKFDGDIITNPPYAYGKDFVLKALDSIPDGHKVAMFLKIQFLESENRYLQLLKDYPPCTVYAFARRRKCGPNGNFDTKDSSSMFFTWIIWEKGNYGRTELKWIY